MNSFVKGWSHGDFQFKKTFLSILIILLAFTLGNVPILLLSKLFPEFSGDSMADYFSYFGFESLFLLQMIPFVAVLLAIILNNKYIHHRSFRWLFSAREKINLRKMVLAFSLWGGLLVLNTAIDFALHPQKFEWNFSLLPFLSTFLILMLFLPLQVAAEELLFRSFVLQGLFAKTSSVLLSILISGIMFGFMHFGNPEVLANGRWLLIFYVLFGVVLSWIAYKDNGIEVTLGFHYANNFFTGVLLTSDDQAFQTNALFKTTDVGMDPISLLWLFVNLAVFILICARCFHWRFRKEANEIPIEKK
ncbi:MAG: CPBP family intramembrane metalloprotease [Flavobacteriia bacterium]|nr:CPBP family intramembrane metalloprotease [Flavobacteriia bacterium]